MTSESDVPRSRINLSVVPGCRHDGPELAKLARMQLPSMTFLHEPELWDNTYRFGAGIHARDNYLLTARAELPDGSSSLAAFFWVDQAIRADYGIDQPWWCINAIAVASRFQRGGLGSGLVKQIREKANDVGVTSIYGLSHPTGFSFWESQEGFTLAPLGTALVPSEPVITPAGLRTTHLEPEPGHRFFYAATDAPGTVVLGPETR